MVKKVEIKIELDGGSISIDCENPKVIFSAWDSEYLGRIVFSLVQEIQRHKENAEAKSRSERR
ncbi:hypothetical protein LCGC14_0522750 [marine sediment metagenome]|uniref:Uncharacterized protein n=1 Tax=marine sediment metagenome TaxID=412755 RepID=A0A0F9V669_9ZZZZ